MISDDDGLITLRDFIRWGASRLNEAEVFFGHGTDNALDEALALVLHAVHLDHGLPPAYLDSRLIASERQTVREIFLRRIEDRIPAPYLTHEARFADLNFFVDERVLIPRSPMAELIKGRFVPWVGGQRVSRILDLCTGSGCIAIACAYFIPEASVDALDISAPALEVAQINVTRHGLEGQVRLIESDLFDVLGEDDIYDVIVSNPPYVGAQEMAALPEGYLHEPALGLASGEEGLDAVSRILRDASGHLTGDGIILVEVGYGAELLAARFPEVPFLWLDLERGGEGVFLLTAEQLERYQGVFDSSSAE